MIRFLFSAVLASASLAGSGLCWEYRRELGIVAESAPRLAFLILLILGCLVAATVVSLLDWWGAHRRETRAIREQEERNRTRIVALAHERIFARPRRRVVYSEVGTLCSTQILFAEPPSPAPVAISDEEGEDCDDGEWCIERADNRNVGLCGAVLYGPSVPEQEIPEEQTCPRCLQLQKQSASH